MPAFGSDSPSENRRSLNSGAAKRLAFEALEQRQLLAADMAEIVGLVRLDLQGDGNAANDTAVVGAQVALYRDNGNGVLDASDALAASPLSTDAQGGYRFSGLQAGQYLVKTSLPGGMKFAGEIAEGFIEFADRRPRLLLGRHFAGPDPVMDQRPES